MKTPGSAEGATSARIRPFLPRLFLSLVAVAFAAFAASALAGSRSASVSYVINGSITNSKPTFTGPAFSLTRVQCGETVTREFGSQTFHYEVYRFQNLRGWYANGQATPASSCVNVSLLVHSGTATAVGYSGSFVPSSPGTRFAGSVGGLGAGQSGDFSYIVCCVAQPMPFDVVVHETIQGGGATYTLLVEGEGIVMTGGGPTPTVSLQYFRASSAPSGVVVRWRTRSERQVLGFNVYRGEARKVRLTKSIVRATGKGQGQSYAYRDRDQGQGKPGRYWLEVVRQGGSKVIFGPALS